MDHVSALSEARFHKSVKSGEVLCARSIEPFDMIGLSRLLTITFTTAAFDRSSLWQFEAAPSPKLHNS
jgi:hypothetical protein